MLLSKYILVVTDVIEKAFYSTVLRGIRVRRGIRGRRVRRGIRVKDRRLSPNIPALSHQSVHVEGILGHGTVIHFPAAL